MAEMHLTPDDLATRFRVPKKTIYKMNSDGTGPVYMRVGKHVRYGSASTCGTGRPTCEHGRTRSTRSRGPPESSHVQKRPGIESRCRAVLFRFCSA